MIASIFITIIAFVAAVFIMKNQIDEKSKKQDTINQKLIGDLKLVLKKVSLDTSSIAKTITTSLEPRFENTVKNSNYELQNDLFNESIKNNIANIGNAMTKIDDFASKIDFVESNISIVSTDVRSNLYKFRDVNHAISQVNLNINDVTSNLDILMTSNSIDIENINKKIHDITNTPYNGSSNTDQQDLVDTNLRIDNISSTMSNLDFENINSKLLSLDTQFKTLLNNGSSNSNNQDLEDSKRALNKFFKKDNFVSTYKDDSGNGGGFNQFFNSSFSIGDTRHFANFSELIDETDTLVTYNLNNDKNISSINTELNSINTAMSKLSLTTTPGGEIINLKQVKDILNSNASQIEELQTNLNDAFIELFNNIEGDLIAKKLKDNDIILKDLTSSNIETDSLNVNGINIETRLIEIRDEFNTLASGQESNTNLNFSTDNDLAVTLGIPNSHFTQQKSLNNSGQQDFTNIPQKYIHSVSGNNTGDLLFHEIDFSTNTSNIKTLKTGIDNISGKNLANKISEDSTASFKNGIRLGINGCLTLNEESTDKPQLQLCDGNCTDNCRKLWDYNFAPEPK